MEEEVVGVREEEKRLADEGLAAKLDARDKEIASLRETITMMRTLNLKVGQSIRPRCIPDCCMSASIGHSHSYQHQST